MINKHKSNKIKENSNTVRHLNNGTDHRHSKSCCDQSSPARRTMTLGGSRDYCILGMVANSLFRKWCSLVGDEPLSEPTRRRFEVIITLLLRHVHTGFFASLFLSYTYTCDNSLRSGDTCTLMWTGLSLTQVHWEKKIVNLTTLSSLVAP